jgi:NhaP-type Na+/H+ or K+/H+ antiporter
MTLGLALGVGMTAQVLARHLRIPGIILLLAAGVLLGPQVANVVGPAPLGAGMNALVSFAVAVILFEGGLSLQISHLRHQAASIRRLVTWGALITAVGGTLAPMLILDWRWEPALLFGTLVIVTGPTVVTPLLRRFRVKPGLATILEAEGVFGDAVGAILAIVALEFVLSRAGVAEAAHGVWAAVSTLGVGVLVGGVGGLLLAALLRVEGLLPEGLENVTILSLVLGLVQVSDAIRHESGIAAAIAAGLVVGNIPLRSFDDLREFKEQLTVMAIGMLFVLLAADVQLVDMQALGWAGVLTVLALVFIVRPANIFISTWRTGVTLREQIFMSWMAPRGIVAAAVASLFARELAAAGFTEGRALQALVFMVIGITVVAQGLTGGAVAKALGLSQPREDGWVILGANAFARAVAEALRSGGEEVVLIDSNTDSCFEAEALGFEVVEGSGLSEDLLHRVKLGSRRGALAMTPNDSANVLFARRARRVFKVARVWAAINPNAHVDLEMLDTCGGRRLFGKEVDMDWWIVQLERGSVELQQWNRAALVGVEDPVPEGMVALALGQPGKAVTPVDAETRSQLGEQVWIGVDVEQREAIAAWMTTHGWEPASCVLPRAIDEQAPA